MKIRNIFCGVVAIATLASVADAIAERNPVLDLVCQTVNGGGSLGDGLSTTIPLYRCEDILGRRKGMKFYSTSPGPCSEYALTRKFLGNMKATILNTTDSTNYCISPSRSLVRADLEGQFLFAQRGGEKEAFSVCNLQIDAMIGSSFRTSISSLSLSPELTNHDLNNPPPCNNPILVQGRPISLQVVVGGPLGAGFGCSVKVSR
jgi:hypothetical protein